MIKVFFDSDVILDLLQERKPWCNDAVRLFEIVGEGVIRGYTSPLALANIYYLMRKHLGQQKGLEHIRTLTQLLDITDLNSGIVKMVLHERRVRDFEDSLQLFSAIEAEIEYLLTRNIDDFGTDTSIQIMLPSQLLSILNPEIRKD